MRKGLMIALAGLAGGAGGAAMAQTLPACERYPGDAPSYACTCTGSESGSVWGSNPYTSDSDLCAAARHAGLIGAEGGAIEARLGGAEESFAGSMANGVESRDWGSYPSSVTFNVKGPRGGGEAYAACAGYPAGAPEVACACTGQEAGTVWGSGPYTADSDICTAALHAGYIDTEGGTVFAVATAGLESYLGSELNGVVSRDWGSYGESFVFDWNR